MSVGLAFTLGSLALLIAWLAPLARLAGGPFTGHMITHMLVVAVAAPLLAWGVAATRFDPVRRAPRLFSAVPISVLELVIVWAFHTPFLHHLARHQWPFYVLEQALFAASGGLLWLSVFGGEPAQRLTRAGAGVLALLLTSMHMTLLGALLALPPRVLFVHAGHAGALSPLDDQHLGGAIMLLVGGVSYLLGGLFMAARLLQRRAMQRPLTLR